MASAATPLLQLLFLRPSFNSSSHFRPLSLHTKTRNPFFSPPLFCLSTSPLLHTASDLQPEEPKPLTLTRTEPPLATFRSSELPNLTVKEKKELASYAHSLGKKLKSQQVGKSGVTPSAAASFVENLESNELLKLKVHNSCPGELPDVVRQLEEATGSVVVGQIGRSVILYRPSLTKMKEAERKKQQVQRFRKSYPPKPYDSNGQVKPSNRGRRGSSRVSSTGFEN